VALGTAALSLALVGPASAEAVVTRGIVTTPFSESGLPDDCRPNITGTIVGSDTVSYQTVRTAQGYHVVQTLIATGRIDWSDGTYSVIESADNVTFYDAANGTTVATVAHEDSGNTYSADGAFLWRVTFHIVERFTVSDGLLRVEFERGRFHFFGGC
jgi:hypothetical protein